MSQSKCINRLLSGSMDTPRHSLSQVSLPEQEEEEPVLLPPPDYSDLVPSRPMVVSTPSPHSTVSTCSGCCFGFLLADHTDRSLFNL